MNTTAYPLSANEPSMLVERGDWSGILEAHRNGVAWSSLCTRMGFPAVGKAILERQADILELFLQNGASPHPVTLPSGRKYSPLWATLMLLNNPPVQERAALLESLLRHGADPNELSQDDETALVYTSKRGWGRESLALIRAGAHVDGGKTGGTRALHEWIRHAFSSKTRKALSFAGKEKVDCASLDMAREVITALLERGAKISRLSGGSPETRKEDDADFAQRLLSEYSQDGGEGLRKMRELVAKIEQRALEQSRDALDYPNVSGVGGREREHATDSDPERIL